jgi:hypothetical protein
MFQIEMENLQEDGVMKLEKHLGGSLMKRKKKKKYKKRSRDLGSGALGNTAVELRVELNAEDWSKEVKSCKCPGDHDIVKHKKKKKHKQKDRTRDCNDNKRDKKHKKKKKSKDKDCVEISNPDQTVMDTPGRRLILDLLAKSIAKIEAKYPSAPFPQVSAPCPSYKPDEEGDIQGVVHAIPQHQSTLSMSDTESPVEPQYMYQDQVVQDQHTVGLDETYADFAHNGDDGGAAGNKEPSDLIIVGETKFSCQACGKSFNDKSNCRRHVKSIHIPEEKAICSICLKSFKNKNSLKCHIRASHRKDDACRSQSQNNNQIPEDFRLKKTPKKDYAVYTSTRKRSPQNITSELLTKPDKSEDEISNEIEISQIQI